MSNEEELLKDIMLAALKARIISNKWISPKEAAEFAFKTVVEVQKIAKNINKME